MTKIFVAMALAFALTTGMAVVTVMVHITLPEKPFGLAQ